MIGGGRVMDHVATIWGSQESRGADWLEVDRNWSPVPEMEKIALGVQAQRGTIDDDRPGERVAAEYQGVGPRGLNVCEGDVVELLEGPHAPRLLKVDHVDPPFGNHVELVLLSWRGSLA